MGQPLIRFTELLTLSLCFSPHVLAKQRDDANNDPRKSEIPIEIRSCEDKLHKLGVAIEDDAMLLRELQATAAGQNEISVLKEQVTKEVEALQESIEDEDFQLSQFKVKAPAFSSEAEDERGEETQVALEKLSSEVNEKLDDGIDQLDKLVDEVSVKERAVSEKMALLNHNKQALASTQAKVDALTAEDGSVTTYKRVVAAIRQFASGNQIDANFDEKDPQTLLSFLDEQLEELVVMGGDAMADVGPAVVKRLKQLVSFTKCIMLYSIDIS
jgi:DNA repair protein RAD50